MEYIEDESNAKSSQNEESMSGMWSLNSSENLFSDQKSIAILRQVGNGKHLSVYKAICTTNLMIVAIKEVIGKQPEFRKSTEKAINELQSFLSSYGASEIEEKDDSSLDTNPIFIIHDSIQLWLLKSEYICNLLGAYINPQADSFCLVFEYMKYGSLEDQMNLGLKPDDRSIGAVAYVILNALNEFHSHNCIHRDIKPSNILIGNNGKLKVSDSLIISKSLRSERGALMYMSPERVKGETYTTSTDIWSLGILLLKYSTNMYPFSANNLWGLADVIKKRARIEVENFMEGIDSFPLDLRDFIFQCLQVQPNLRASAQDLLQHPFIQKYVVDQCNESKDATCISNYSKQNDEFYKELDLEKSLDAVFVRLMEEKLLQVWIDPCDVSLTLKSLSASDLQFLSQQLNIEVEFTTKLYDEKMVSMNVALKHCVQVNRLNNKMLKPNAIISQTIRELANNHAVISKATDVRDTDNQPKFTEDVNKSLKSNQNRKSHHITSQDKFDGSKSYENLFKFLLKCRIPEVDAQKYANTFIDMGYDDMQSIQEDLDSETLNGIMKPGHIIRFLKDDNDYEINQVKDNRAQVEELKFQNDLKNILELPNEFNEELKILPIKHHPGLNKEKKYLLKIKQDSASEYSSKTVFDIREVNRGDWYVTIAFVRPSLDIVALRHYPFHEADKEKDILKELKVLSELKENKQRLPWVSGTFSDVWNVASPYFVSFRNAYIDRDICMVYDYMAGGSLQNQIDKKKFRDMDDCGVVAYSMLNALSEMHKRNVQHGEFKPSKILISGWGHCKLSDFGVFTELRDKKHKILIPSSYIYMSPEKIQDRQCSKASDIWSLGISLIVYATDVCPYPINTFWLLAEAIQHGPSTYPLLTFPDDFKDFVNKCTAIKEEDRSTADDLLKHPFITNHLNRSLLNGLDPLKLKNFSLNESKEDRQKELEFILDLNIKVEMDEHIEKLRSTDLRKEVGSLKVLTKTHVAWLATQLFLDMDYAQDIYAEKMINVHSSIDATFGKVRKMKVKEFYKSVYDPGDQHDDSNLIDDETFLANNSKYVEGDARNEKKVGKKDLVTDEALLELTKILSKSTVKSPFQFLRSISSGSSPDYFCKMKRVTSNKDLPELLEGIDYSSKQALGISEDDSLKKRTQELEFQIPIVPFSLSHPDNTDAANRINKDFVQVEFKDQKPVKKGLEFEQHSDISLFEPHVHNNPIMCSQSYNDLNNPSANRYKHSERPGEYSSLLDGDDDDSDEADIEYDGLYF